MGSSFLLGFYKLPHWPFMLTSYPLCIHLRTDRNGQQRIAQNVGGGEKSVSQLGFGQFWADSACPLLGLRIWSRKGWGFESPLSHQRIKAFTGGPFSPPTPGVNPCRAIFRSFSFPGPISKHFPSRGVAIGRLKPYPKMSFRRLVLSLPKGPKSFRPKESTFPLPDVVAEKQIPRCARKDSEARITPLVKVP